MTDGIETDETKAWERQDGDTSASFRAFQIYLHQSPIRSLQATADEYYNKPSSNRRQIARWSSDHNWQARIRAYDDFIANQRIEERLKLSKEVKERSENLINSLQLMVIKVMNKMESDDYDVRDLLTLANASAKIFDQARAEFDNMPTQRHDIQDWRSQAVKDIQSKAIDFDSLADAFDHDLAIELFRQAGVEVEV